MRRRITINRYLAWRYQRPEYPSTSPHLAPFSIYNRIWDMLGRDPNCSSKTAWDIHLVSSRRVRLSEIRREQARVLEINPQEAEGQVQRHLSIWGIFWWEKIIRFLKSRKSRRDHITSSGSHIKELSIKITVRPKTQPWHQPTCWRTIWTTLQASKKTQTWSRQ